MSSLTYEAKYGITVAQRDELWQAQGGKCSICKDAITLEDACTDHCHQSGTVRHLLCNNCNVILGLAYDRPEVLEAAAQYLRFHAALQKRLREIEPDNSE